MQNAVEGWIKRKISKTRFLRIEIDLFEKEMCCALAHLKSALEENCDLFVFYTKIIDYVGHFLAWDTRAMWHLYERADKFVEKLERRVGDNTLILVISDHGMKRTGMHSDHAFYSTNIVLNLRNAKMTDFYDIITKKLTSK